MKGPEADEGASASGAKTPRTARGRRTLRALLDAAADEFGEKGFHDAAIAKIAERAGTAIGSFYTYFDSKEAIFRALVQDMSRQVKESVVPRILSEPDRLSGERAGIEAFLSFVREHKALYTIIDQARFVAADAHHDHYQGIADGYRMSLAQAEAKGEIRSGDNEVRAWAIMGMNVFLGLRYGAWSSDGDPRDIAAAAIDLIANGLAQRRAESGGVA
ncbi:TetR/AcrR family transcriptional regulator [Sphingomonas sp. CGMCC 1.13654]|uniref:TetR/AcrR family transcriptional regulator n=1 Tax=Sphingomonas chungangi TaxID=2683589 RepID=A0A838L6V0_9SPHN|nr:TetR/AcrR family transcriptional regulator [Sphingomonas chungangi]MBA2933876.1 TetR/AcrR family transcriptional regulator [Sphingomonas chungangi]MVW55206.1 TetR family transcriptional regulator [Sphingomonas chungangi]